MFTGIISHIGKIKNNSDTFLDIEIPLDLINKIQKGISIAVNGVCLTVIKIQVDNIIKVEIMSETIKRTTLGKLTFGALVNLELPATPESFLSGHIVQGHIDAVGNIISILPEGNSHLITISISEQFNKYIIEKGSIAVNGISLTIIEANKTDFTVGIIPFTWEHTMLHLLKEGDKVNIETDVIAKFIKKLLTN